MCAFGEPIQLLQELSLVCLVHIRVGVGLPRADPHTQRNVRADVGVKGYSQQPDQVRLCG